MESQIKSSIIIPKWVDKLFGLFFLGLTAGIFGAYWHWRPRGSNFLGDNAAAIALSPIVLALFVGGLYLYIHNRNSMIFKGFLELFRDNSGKPKWPVPWPLHVAIMLAVFLTGAAISMIFSIHHLPHNTSGQIAFTAIAFAFAVVPAKIIGILLPTRCEDDKCPGPAFWSLFNEGGPYKCSKCQKTFGTAINFRIGGR